MARHTIEQLTDDLDGSAADRTVRFGWDGTDYEVDLNSEHAEQFEAALERFVQAARRTGGRSGRRSGPGRRPRAAAASARSRSAQPLDPASADSAELPGVSEGGIESGDDLTTGDAPAQDAAQDGAATQRAVRAPRRRSTSSDEPDLAAVRQWAQENGMAVSARGRLSAAVREAYRAAHR